VYRNLAAFLCPLAAVKSSHGHLVTRLTRHRSTGQLVTSEHTTRPSDVVHAVSAQKVLNTNVVIGPIPWGHSGPLCHALSLSLSSSSSIVVVVDINAQAARDSTASDTCRVNGRAAARSGEWAQHFSNASCYRKRADQDIQGGLLTMNDEERKL